MTSFDSVNSFSTSASVAPRRHSWPEAVQSLRPSTSGIFDPLPDQEEVFIRSSMTSRSSNHSTNNKKRSFKPCIYEAIKKICLDASMHFWPLLRKGKMQVVEREQKPKRPIIEGLSLRLIKANALLNVCTRNCSLSFA